MELFWVDGVEMLLEDYIWDESLEAYKKCMNLWSLHDGELDSMVQFLELCSLHLRNMDTRHTPACKFCVLGGKKNILFKKIPLILHMFLKIFKVVNLLLFWKHQINIKICLIYICVCVCMRGLNNTNKRAVVKNVGRFSVSCLLKNVEDGFQWVLKTFDQQQRATWIRYSCGGMGTISLASLVLC